LNAESRQLVQQQPGLDWQPRSGSGKLFCKLMRESHHEFDDFEYSFTQFEDLNNK